MDRLIVTYSSPSGTSSSSVLIVTQFKVLGSGADKASKPSLMVKSEASAAVKYVYIKSGE